MSIVSSIKKAVTKPEVKGPAPEAVPEPKYSVVIKMNDETFTCKTDDLFSALSQFRPPVFKSKVVITISNAHDTVERVMMIAKARMLFRNKMTMQVFVKNILLALKNN